MAAGSAENQSSNNTPAIAGGIAAAVVVIGAVLGVFFLKKRRHTSKGYDGTDGVEYSGSLPRPVVEKAVKEPEGVHFIDGSFGKGTVPIPNVVGGGKKMYTTRD